MRFLNRPLDWFLLATALVSIGAILLGHEDSYIRTTICAKVNCPHYAHANAWEKIAYDLGVGSIVSLFFYWLVVRLPENAKRRRIRNSFALHFKEFKEDCIATMLMVTDGSFAWGFQEQLVDQKQFREYFKQKILPDQDRWDSLHNKMDQYSLGQLLTYLEILRAEILFVLSALDIEDRKVLEFLKQLSSTIVIMRRTTLDYDSMKSFGRFMWQVFAGFSSATGYQKRDFFEEMIKAI